MKASRKIPGSIQLKVRERAAFLCEYCHSDERWQHVPFTLDHVVPLNLAGQDMLENLALACFQCNRRKSAWTTAADPRSGEIVDLFNPRAHQWADHFTWSRDGLLIVPLTAIGRATAELMSFNRERIVLIRSADVAIDRHPPDGDPIEK